MSLKTFNWLHTMAGSPLNHYDESPNSTLIIHLSRGMLVSASLVGSKLYVIILISLLVTIPNLVDAKPEMRSTTGSPRIQGRPTSHTTVEIAIEGNNGTSTSLASIVNSSRRAAKKAAKSPVDEPMRNANAAPTPP